MYPDCVLAAWQIAKRQGVVNPENTFASVKRFIGRKMNEVKEESKQVPYKVGPFNLFSRSCHMQKYALWREASKVHAYALCCRSYVFHGYSIISCTAAFQRVLCSWKPGEIGSFVGQSGKAWCSTTQMPEKRGTCACAADYGRQRQC